MALISDDNDLIKIKNTFLQNVDFILQASEAIDSPVRVSEKELKSIALDHSYAVPHGFNESRPSQRSSAESEDDVEETESLWNPVKELKQQFFLGSNLFPNPLISSFDVACIEELNPNGSPVEKVEVLSACRFHSRHVERCALCTFQTPNNPITKGDHLRCINNKLNHLPQARYSLRKYQESLDGENGENVNKLRILKLIEDLAEKKRNKQPVSCQICGNKFTAVATLKNHYLSHANIKPYCCSLCESSFSRSWSLRYHTMIHNEEFRFTCSRCSRKFRHTSHYKAHTCKDLNPGEQLGCQTCPRSFKNKNSLRRHLKDKHLNA